MAFAFIMSQSGWHYTCTNNDVHRAALNFRLLGICFIGLCTVANAQLPAEPKETPGTVPLSSILERMQAAQTAPQAVIPYEVIREYRVLPSQNSAQPSSVVIAQIDYLSPNDRSYAIQKRTGSGRGEDVVRRILQHETAMSPLERSEGAIDNTNYFFFYKGMANLNGNPCYLLALEPKRKEEQLIRGTAWVDSGSFLIRRVEGELIKSPSWMLKKVNVTIDFADIGGIWLQTGMQAIAEVRFVGTQVLESKTTDAHVGNLLAQAGANSNNPPMKNRRAKHSPMPAIVIAPMNSGH